MNRLYLFATFNFVCDMLLEAVIEVQQLCNLLATRQPAASEMMAECVGYATDATSIEQIAARTTLADQGALRAQEFWHRYSWLGRPDLQRIRTENTGPKIAAEQARSLTRRDPHSRVITADSCDHDRCFLNSFTQLENPHALVRLQSNQE